MTMPAASSTLDVIATSNGGNLYASRIIVKSVVNLAPRPLSVKQAVNRASTY